QLLIARFSTQKLCVSQCSVLAAEGRSGDCSDHLALGPGEAGIFRVHDGPVVGEEGFDQCRAETARRRDVGDHAAFCQSVAPSLAELAANFFWCGNTDVGHWESPSCEDTIASR